MSRWPARIELLEPDRSAVVVVDVQGRLVDQVEDPERLRGGIERLVRTAGLFEVPILVTEQYPQGLGPTEAQLLELISAQSGEHRVVGKTCFSCCGEREFFDAISELRPGVRAERLQLVVVGIEAHVCVQQTVFDLLARGSTVVVCAEGVSGRGERTRRRALEEMARSGARLAHYESVGFEWARSKEHPSFKAFSALLREGQID